MQTDSMEQPKLLDLESAKILNMESPKILNMESPKLIHTESPKILNLKVRLFEVYCFFLQHQVNYNYKPGYTTLSHLTLSHMGGTGASNAPLSDFLYTQKFYYTII